MSEDAAGATTASGKGGRLSTIAGIGAVSLLAAAAGTAIAFLIAVPASVPPAAEPDVAAAEETQEASDLAAAGGALALVALDPVVTNIASPPATIVRIEASLVLDPEKVDDAAILASQIGGDTLAFARSLELAQIEGARGLLHLREDLKERAMLRSPAVSDYVIHSLIAQ